MPSTEPALTHSSPHNDGAAGGYLHIAGAALCWGFSAGLAKFLFLRHADPVTLAQVRASFAFLVLLAIAVFWRRSMLRVGLRDAAGLAALGLFGMVASTFGYLVAIQRTTVATAIVLQYTAPIWVILYSALFVGERLTARRALAAALSFAGCVLAVGGYRLAGTPGLAPGASGRAAGLGPGIAWNSAGVAWGVVSAFSFSFFTIWGARMARRVALWTSLLYALGTATLFWAVVRSPARLVNEGYSASQWALLLLYAVISILLPYALFYSGLRRLRPPNVMVTSTLEPVFAILFAFLLAGEGLAPLQFLGMAGVLGAVLILATGRQSENERQKRLRHFDELLARIPKRPQSETDAELKAIREARRSGGRRHPVE